VIREGRWDCGACGITGILGRVRVCPDCGAPRPDDVSFYLSEDAPATDDEEQLLEARAGADWVCEHCGAGNSNRQESCKQCGADRGTSPTLDVTDYSTGAIPRGSSRSPGGAHSRVGGVASRFQRLVVNATTDDEPAASDDSGTGQASPWLGSWPSAGGINLAVLAAIGIAAAVLGMIWLIIPRNESVTVQEKSWARAITIEAYRTVREEAWSIPAGGRYVGEHSAISHYESVLDHYETRSRQDCHQVPDGIETYSCGVRDLGNGYFEDRTCTRPTYRIQCDTEHYQEPVYRQEPVYATKYTYNIDRWVFDRKAESSGVNDTPFWATFTLAENERENGRSEEYHVRLVNKTGMEFTYSSPETEWASFQVGEPLAIKVNRLGKVLKVEQK